MNKLVLLTLSGIFSTASFAQTSTTVPEAQKQGSEKAQGTAEATHNARPHGTDGSAKQSQAQTMGSARAKADAEDRHLGLTHTGKKNSADAQQAEDARKL